MKLLIPYDDFGRPTTPKDHSVYMTWVIYIMKYNADFYMNIYKHQHYEKTNRNLARYPQRVDY